VAIIFRGASSTYGAFQFRNVYKVFIAGSRAFIDEKVF
jgi:hypothetical protein